jgi:hypothetical protein
MGYDAVCTLRVEGNQVRGTAWLEHKDLVFRGSTRLSIPLETISSARARDGVLVVRFGSQSAEFEIGACAEKWAARIMNPPSRLDKLGVKPGMKVVLIGLSDDDFIKELTGRGADLAAPAGRNAPGADLIFYGAEKRSALRQLGTLKRRILQNGAIWVVRPKGHNAITERDTMAAGKAAGLVDVKVVSFSDSQTAEKFVIPVAKRQKSKGLRG